MEAARDEEFHPGASWEMQSAERNTDLRRDVWVSPKIKTPERFKSMFAGI